MNLHDADHARLIAKHVQIASANPPDERDAYLEFSPSLSENDFNRGKPNVWPARPGTEIINPKTGEITVVPPRRVDRDECVNVPKLALKLALGPRKTKDLLLSMGLLQAEIVVKHNPSMVDQGRSRPEYSHEHRLSGWAVNMRHGIRVKSPTSFEFDLITQSGVRYVDEMTALASALRGPKEKLKAKPKATVEAAIQADPTLRVIDIVRRTGLSQPTVWRHYTAYRNTSRPGLAVRPFGYQQEEVLA